MLKNLDSEWKDFCAKCYPGGMSADQRLQLYRAFYGGALVYSGILHGIAGLPEPQALAAIKVLNDELIAAGKNVVLTTGARN